MRQKQKRPGKPGRFVPRAMLLIVADAAPQFVPQRRINFRLARPS
jgi:hypothetical protein